MKPNPNQPSILYGNDASKVFGGNEELIALAKEYQRAHFPEEDLQIVTEYARLQMQNALSEGKSAIAINEGRTVSMASQEYFGMWRRRPVFSLEGVVTLPPYRGRGFSSQVQERCIQEVLSQTPNALIRIFTRTPEMRDKYRKLVAKGSCEELTKDEIIEMEQSNNRPTLSEQQIQAMKTGTNYWVFLYDPTKKSEW